MLAAVQRAIAERPEGTRLLFLSDYDGTLVEFHPNPTIPRPSKEMAELLARVAARTDMSMGIVSGRRIADLRTRTQLPARVYLAGLHGLEIEVGASRWHHPKLGAARRHVRSLYDRLAPLHERVPGLILEDKHVSIAVHVRGVDPQLRAEALAQADAAAAEWVSSGMLRRLPGNMVLEFLPNIAAHKGAATLWIARDVEARCQQPVWTVFVGDDVTDEDAFKVIVNGIGVLVGSRETHATHTIASTREVARLLAWIARSGPSVRQQ